ncbi:uncharacterized protein RCO7_08917 [Rhynchosporium graminicola]|uniref:Uncharacterized protein n=1 Tax=Rhynchosporium graminicola TaxID=2792576 RepID=A0A1E1KJK9_9HELO|nr:uncharacterized protein RCO7_08917 [Rhynchosporium commune]
MSYYENQQQWPATTSQQSWEQQTPPARSGASSAIPREESGAFSTQIEEVDRAIDNLAKSGKMGFPNIPGSGGRRESMPMSSGPPRAFAEQYDPRMGGGPPRHHSVSGDFGDQRSHSVSNLQNFYASQRHGPPRAANEAEQVMQAKRRMAAQRERELRNYHQEQQYNRSVSAEISTMGSKQQLDRTMSPNSGMNEEERRELIARQRSALYGEGVTYNENGSFDENGTPRPGTRGSGSHSANGIRGHSPLAFDRYNAQTQGENQGQAQAEAQTTAGQAPGQQRSRANSTSSPSSNPTSSFSLFESAAQQSSRTSTSSPGGSPPHQGKGTTSSGVAPIGTRPSGQAPNPALNKRSTTPLPSPLSYGFAASSEDNQGEKNDGRNASAASNSNAQNQQDAGLGWGSKSAVWGKNSLGVQASVWG